MSRECAEAAYREFSRSLHRYLMRRLANAQSAQDVAQEAYLRLLCVDDSQLVRAPQAYLYRIASNLVYELRLRQQRDPVTVDSRLVDHVSELLSDPAYLDLSERINLERLLESVLSQLPPLYAAILVLRKRDGKSLDEIARELNISIHTARKYLYRALSQMRTANWSRSCIP
jgi:RNA polymerase sigma factor (sigma-70 family)